MRKAVKISTKLHAVHSNRIVHQVPLGGKIVARRAREVDLVSVDQEVDQVSVDQEKDQVSSYFSISYSLMLLRDHAQNKTNPAISFIFYNVIPLLIIPGA